MKEIDLKRGFKALVDDEDYEKLSKYSWCVRKGRNGVFYAVRYAKENYSKAIFMHREILDVNDPQVVVDHIDHDGLNNRRFNIREATIQENSRNKRALKGSSSKYLGVYKVVRTYKDKTSHYWAAEIAKKYLGCYKSEKEAAAIYDKEAMILYGEFANLNFNGKHEEVLAFANAKNERYKNEAKAILDLQTGIYYQSVREVAIAKNLSIYKIHNAIKNNTLSNMHLHYHS